jgi:hypothetical protein
VADEEIRNLNFGWDTPALQLFRRVLVAGGAEGAVREGRTGREQPATENQLEGGGNIANSLRVRSVGHRLRVERIHIIFCFADRHNYPN